MCVVLSSTSTVNMIIISTFTVCKVNGKKINKKKDKKVIDDDDIRPVRDGHLIRKLIHTQ